MELQESGEMYLETIFILSKKLSKVRSIDIVEHMNYTKPSVSRAVGLLKNSGYINVDMLGYITLTKLGEKLATNIYERHTILTKFLKQLGVSENVAIEDACKIEHYISPETFEAIKKYISKT